MPHQKFDVAKLERLNDPARFADLDPTRMWDALGSPEPSALVEIGAGTGLFSARFAAMAPGATVYAVDVAPEMVAWMRENRPEVAAGRVVPVLAEETRIPLADALADIVVTINLHHELADGGAPFGLADAGRGGAQPRRSARKRCCCPAVPRRPDRGSGSWW